MTTPATPVSTITDATSSMEGELLTVGGIGLGIGVAVYVLRRGWGFLKSFAR